GFPGDRLGPGGPIVQAEEQAGTGSRQEAVGFARGFALDGRESRYAAVTGRGHFRPGAAGIGRLPEALVGGAKNHPRPAGHGGGQQQILVTRNPRAARRQEVRALIAAHIQAAGAGIVSRADVEQAAGSGNSRHGAIGKTAIAFTEGLTTVRRNHQPRGGGGKIHPAGARWVEGDRLHAGAGNLVEGGSGVGRFQQSRAGGRENRVRVAWIECDKVGAEGAHGSGEGGAVFFSRGYS